MRPRRGVTARPPVQPRFVPVHVDIPVLGVRKGDLLAVVPVDNYRGDAIYMLTLEGTPMPVHARTARNGDVAVAALHPGGGATTMTRTQFCDLLLGRVLATCKVLDRSLLDM
jgi:hypothetical protein